MEREYPRQFPEIKASLLKTEDGAQVERSNPFVVTAGNEDVGIFYASGDKSRQSSFEWKTKIDFLHVEKSVSAISSLLLEKPFDFRSPKEFRVVAEVSQKIPCIVGGEVFIRTEPTTTHHLGSVREFINYRRKMATYPISIGSVNYDILDAQSGKAFSLQIGNPALTRDTGAKIRLFSDKPWCENVTEWVLNHHEKEEEIRKSGVKPKEISTVLSFLANARLPRNET